MHDTTSMLGPEDLVLCAGTLLRTPLSERIPIVADAGYDGMSLFTTDLQGDGAEALDPSELRRRLEDAGLRVAEIDPLMLWYPSAQPGPGLFSFTSTDVLGMAEAVGARAISAIPIGGSPSHEELTDAFGRLCEEAAERGALVVLEFMPFSAVRSLAEAVGIVQGAGQANGGIMLDVWHLLRSGGTLEEVRDAARRIFGVQINDAPAEAEENLQLETMQRRRLPGDGDANVAGVLRALRQGGSPAPIGVEVFSDELAALPPSEVARRTYDAARRVIAASR